MMGQEHHCGRAVCFAGVFPAPDNGNGFPASLATGLRKAAADHGFERDAVGQLRIPGR